MRTIRLSIGAAVLLLLSGFGAATTSRVARAATVHQSAPACTWSHLFANVLWTRGITGAPGSGAIQGRIAYTQNGKQPCQLQGWVKARILNGANAVLPVTETKVNPRGPANALQVHIPGHGSVITRLTWLNWCKGTIKGPITLRVTLPNHGGTRTLAINQLG